MTRSVMVVCRLKLRTRLLFPGVAAAGACCSISRRMLRAKSLETFGWRVAPPVKETHMRSAKACTPTPTAFVS